MFVKNNYLEKADDSFLEVDQTLRFLLTEVRLLNLSFFPKCIEWFIVNCVQIGGVLHKSFWIRSFPGHDK